MDTKNAKEIIIRCLNNNTLDKLYHIIVECFHSIDDLSIDREYWMRSSKLIICIIDAYRYNESDYDIYSILGKLLSHPKIDDDDVDGIIYCAFDESENENNTNRLKDFIIINYNKTNIDIDRVYEISLNNNNTIITKFLIEEFNIDPTLKNNLTLHSFSERFNVKMVRYLAKRKDVRKKEQLSEQEIIEKFAY